MADSMTEATPAPSRRILLVDDNPTNLRVLFQMLDGRGHELLIAKSGEEALRLAREADPALILLDVMMPGIDGFETCRRLKAEDTTRDTPVIFLSARHEVADKVEGLSLGAVDYIAKPIQVEEVIARVDAHLETHDRLGSMREQVRELRDELDDRETGSVPGPDRVRALIAGGESELVEFKSTLRWNLKAERADKAIEDAWLKTVVAFLNSEGGTLLVGVADDGTVLGIKSDGFQSDDHFLLHVNNLIRQHIGPEYASSISYGLCPIDDASVLAIVCARSIQPAYLRRGDAEDLYVRIGPGSRRLTARQAVEFVSSRR